MTIACTSEKLSEADDGNAARALIIDATLPDVTPATPASWKSCRVGAGPAPSNAASLPSAAVAVVAAAVTTLCSSAMVSTPLASSAVAATAA